MTIKDIGPQPQSFDLEAATRANTNYRTVAWSGRYLQLTLMSIPAGGDIGLEVHAETDQFLRLDAGRGRVEMGPSRDRVTFTKEVSDGWSVLIPAGTWHNVINIGQDPMQVYAIDREIAQPVALGVQLLQTAWELSHGRFDWRMSDDGRPFIDLLYGNNRLRRTIEAVLETKGAT